MSRSRELDYRLSAIGYLPTNVVSARQSLNKRQKANGGCLGIKSRRRTWYTAKSIGEPCAGAEPVVSEWGNPAGRPPATGS